MPAGVPPGRVVLVTASTRLPAGQLSWPAWQAVHAGPVIIAELDRQLPALRAAGVRVQPYPEHATAEVAGRLHALALAGEVGTWCGPAALAPDLAGWAPAVGVEVVAGAADPPGAALLDVVAVMDRLRSPGGCPWDARQTHSSLKAYLLEETYEALEAIEDEDPAALREELGDVLLQIAFHARLAQEGRPAFSIDDVAGDLVAKLVRRHPHVFAGAAADLDTAAGDLEKAWEAQKAAEKGRTSAVDGVPLGQPALSLAARLQKRATRQGAPVPGYPGPGGELWEVVRRCAAAGLDPEQELRGAARTYRDQVVAAETALRSHGHDPAAATAAQWSAAWRE